jgi:two-component system sensor histidine kinase BaeS
MRLPRLRIAHQLSLLIAASVVLAVLAVGALSLWNLRSGFTDYLALRDEVELTRLVKLVERYASADPSMNWLRQDREAMRALMDEFTGNQGRRPPRPPPGPGDPARRDRPPPRPAASTGSLPDRVAILDAQGQRLAGHQRPSWQTLTVRPITVDGAVVATIELAAEPQPEGLDALFLQRQYAGLGWAALGTILASVMAAWGVAGLWSRPLRELQRASHNIANGHRAGRLQPTGALEIAQLMEDVNTMTAALTRLEEARRIWIAQISHELRTPLAVLRGELEAIEDGARQPTPGVIAGLGDEVMQLSRLVNDLHTLSMADIDGLRCEFAEGDAHALLLRVIRRFDEGALQRGLRLEITSPGNNATLPACWDFGRIEQMLTNLFTNSLRYTDAPGVIRVGWHGEGGQFTLTMADSAPGVSAADLPQLFEPLFRADRSRQRGADHGSGLGLSIVKTIVNAHRGTVTASPSPLGGLCLRVQLPLQAGNIAA